MTRIIRCIDCPKGCSLSVDIENSKVVSISGNECPKGEKHAISEVENPVRILTSSVLSNALAMKMIPVRTDGPIPKNAQKKAMEEIKRIRINQPVCVGTVIVENFLELGINLIATRDCDGYRKSEETF
jgi:CxxC motif-containing protein